jgi:hypothetical protein
MEQENVGENLGPERDLASAQNESPEADFGPDERIDLSQEAPPPSDSDLREGDEDLAGPTARRTQALPDSVQTAAAFPSSKYFDLKDGSTMLIRDKTLKGTRTAIQSFGFDKDNKRIYVLQLDGSAVDGNLWVTQLDYVGNYLGYMRLLACGHGVSMGVQSQGAGKNPWIWTEYKGKPNAHGDLRGTRLMRFHWNKGVTIAPNSSYAHQHTPVPGSFNNTCNIDPVNNRLALRYQPATGGGTKIAIYNTEDVGRNKYTPLITVTQPAGPGPSFQGYALYGNYLYFLYGNRVATCPGVKDGGSTTIQMMNVLTGAVSAPVYTNAGYTIGGREPEGMAIQVPDPAQPTKVRLCFGFAGVPSCSDTSHRRASIYYKDVLRSA